MLRRLRVDHLVCGVPGALPDAMAKFEKLTGVAPAAGGTVEQLKEVVQELFTALDKDGSKFLEKDEVKTIASQLHGKIGGEKEFNDSAFEEAF